VREPFRKFFADRGTHLAAMIAYFALLSFVPLVFLALALLGLTGRADETSYLVTELKRVFPRSSISSIVTAVRTIQENATTLGIVGGVVLLWSSLSLFSVLESALNIVYGRPNRSFLRGKALAVVFMLGSLIALFVSLLIGSVGFDILRRSAPGFAGNSYVAYTLSVVVSMLGVLIFLVSVYYRLTNVRLAFREVLPGAVTATIALEASFQVLPVYLRLSNHVVALQALGGPAILLVWLYVMANVIVFGAEVNWWLYRSGREPKPHLWRSRARRLEGA
jgi:membrane protein